MDVEFDLPAPVVESGLAWLRASGLGFANVMQEDPTPATEEWAGASSNGTTRVTSGPDVSKVNCTVHLTTSRGTVAVFLGCFNAARDAEPVQTAFTAMLSELGQGQGASGKALLRTLATDNASAGRTTEQLRLGLCPCAHCGVLHCTQRCSGCGNAFYCSREHQAAAWAAHKKSCKKSRAARKGTKKLVKRSKKKAQEEREAYSSASRLVGCASDAEVAAAKPHVAALAVPGELPFCVDRPQTIVAALAYFDDGGEAAWDGGVRSGLLPALVALMKLDKGDDIQRPILFTQHVCTTLLHGAVRTGTTGTFDGVNAARALELFHREEGGFRALLGAVDAAIRRSINPRLSSQLRPLMNGVARDVLRFVIGMMARRSTGRPLALAFAAEAAPTLRRLMKALDLPEHRQALDPGNAVEGLVNQLAALFHCWVEAEGRGAKFFAALKLGPMQRYMYEMSAKSSAAAMIRKGATLSQDECRRAMQEAQQRMGPPKGFRR